MGASESTARPNRSTEDEGEGPPNNTPGGNSGGNSGGNGAAALAGAAAGIAVAAWGISKLMSNNDTETQETAHAHRLQNEPSSTFSPYDSLVAAGGSNQLPLSRWSPPPPGRFKMNTDGSCPNPLPSTFDGASRGPSGIGGILRDHNGKWVRGFRQFIGVTDPLTFELRAILKGLELLDKLKIKKAVLETDSQPAYGWVSRRDDGRGRSAIVRDCWMTIERCRDLIVKNEVDVELIPREGNRCADKLARMAIETEEEQYVEIKDVPYELMSLVANDAKGLRW